MELKQKDVDLKDTFSGCEKCSIILKQETDLLETIGSLQIEVRQAVLNREWADYELLTSRMAEYSSQFELLERERIGIFHSFSPRIEGSDESAGFYSMIAQLPLPLRKELSELYRDLKMAILKIRLANESLTQYLDEAKISVKSFIDAAFPDRKGRLYSRLGTHVQSDVRSMVLNRSF